MLAIDRKSDLRYEFDELPGPGTTLAIATGLHWLRMPLPFALGHINLWLLDDGGTWALVDTGVSTDDARAIWQRTFDDTMQGRPAGRVFVTHLHPDHAGCAGWLCEHFDAPLSMTREEYLLCRVLVADTGRAAPLAGDRFYKGAGFPAEAMENYHKIFGFFGRYVSPLPESYRRMRDADRIEIGERIWEVVVGRGHSPEHACLFDADANILISGDQLLPTISSNVSVYPTEPEADPLGEWLDSLEQLKSRVPADVLVLPAHGRPFRGAHDRLDELIAEHRDCLDRLEEFCREPRRAIDMFQILFRSKVDSSNLIMATGESVAHLNYLLKRGRIDVDIDADGVRWYRSGG